MSNYVEMNFDEFRRFAAKKGVSIGKSEKAALADLDRLAVHKLFSTNKRYPKYFELPLIDGKQYVVQFSPRGRHFDALEIYDNEKDDACMYGLLESVWVWADNMEKTLASYGIEVEEVKKPRYH